MPGLIAGEEMCRRAPPRLLVQHGRGQGGLPFKPLKETSKQIILTCGTVQMYRIGVGNKSSRRRSLIDDSTGTAGMAGPAAISITPTRTSHFMAGFRP